VQLLVLVEERWHHCYFCATSGQDCAKVAV